MVLVGGVNVGVLITAEESYEREVLVESTGSALAHNTFAKDKVAPVL